MHRWDAVTCTKLHTAVDTPAVVSVRKQDNDVEYRLRAVVCHYGHSHVTGHYTTRVRENNIWEVYDDNKVCVKLAYEIDMQK